MLDQFKCAFRILPAVLMILLPVSASSQDATVQPGPTLIQKEQTPSRSLQPDMPVAGALTEEDIEAQPLYAQTTLDNLVKSYFLLTDLDINDNNIIDQYMMVTECELFKQFYTNDFEWNKVRGATRDFIKLNKAHFPKRFEFIQPLYLDRYDFKVGGFFLMPQSKLLSVTRLQISGNRLNEYPCVKQSSKYNEYKMPVNAVLNMERPLNYNFVRAAPELADEYLAYLKKYKIDTSEGRPAYIRYRVKVEQDLGTVEVKGKIYANFYGSIESVSVFGDRELLIKFDERSY